MEQHGSSGAPLDHRALRTYASDIAQQCAGKNWSCHFHKRHPETVTAKPAKLDPKRAKNFNEAVVADFFQKLEDLDKKYNGLPPAHLWNFDEKGIQLGGGRKNSGRVYFYLHSQCNRY